MSKLYEITDAYAPEETIDSLPVEQPVLPTERPRVVINTAEFDKPKPDPLLDKVKSGVSGIGDAIKYASELDQKFTSNILNLPKKAYENSDDLVKGIKNLLGLGEEERYQLWPEKVVREALTSAGDIAKPNPYPEGSEQWQFYENKRQEGMVPAAMAISALAGSGGLAGTGAKAGEVALGATPFLRPALKHKDRLYKGKPGQEHQDIIPKELYDDFSRKAMSGEDLAEYNFGFINDKGHFLDREKALKYGIDTGIIDPHAGKFGALTSTLMADSSRPGIAIEAMNKAPAFYSAVEHTVKNIPQAKMTGDQWLGTLGNKPGVKPDELEWIGLKGFLEENKGKPVTKQQIEEYVAANKVELKEVNKTQQYNSNLENDPNFHGEGLTKYQSYQLPGGENYKELLLTLPQAKLSAEAAGKNLYDNFVYRGGGQTWEQLAPETRKHWMDRATEQGRGTDFDASKIYRSSHWDEPNILAHVRMNDRNIDGKKSLHLEEIQSDWHQQGRDRGYKEGVKEIKGFKPEELKLEKGEYDWSGVSPDGRSAKVGQGVAKTEQEARDYLTRHLNKLAAEKNSQARIAESDKLPDAPFKKSWHELALKRMIREAAEKGYDRLSWTPGEAQAARYDLSKSVSTVVYKDGQFTAISPTGQHVINNQTVPKEKLADYIGKEAAEKLLKQEPHNGAQALQGEKLKIGGEGMKGFYDQIIPKALEKLGKEHGVKVKQDFIANKDKEWPFPIRVASDGKKYWLEGKDPRLDHAKEVSLSKKFDSYADADVMRERFYKGETEPVFYIDIPQSLKDVAMKKGFPLFSSTPGYMFVPFDGDPFENKK